MPAKKQANKAKAAAAKKHTNPKGRVAFFCYVTPSSLKAIKLFRKTKQSQGHVIDALVDFWLATELMGKRK